MKENRLENDVFKISALLIASIIVVYLMPKAMNYLFFSLVLISFVNSKNHIYFWIAFWFIIIDFPGGLFMYGGAYKQLPTIPLFIGSAKLSIVQLIPLILFLKAYNDKRKKKIVFKKDLYLLLLIFIIQFVIGFLFGISFNYIYNTILLLINLTLIYSLPKLLDQKDIINFDRIIFIIVFVAFVTQVFTILTGRQFIDFFTSIDYYGKNYLMAGEEQTARIISSPFIILYSLHKAFFYLFYKKKIFSMNYLNTIIIISFISIFFSATRAWILASLAVFFLVSVIYKKDINLKIIGKTGFTILILLTIILLFFPQVMYQINNSFIRFKTLETVFAGDITMGGDFYRVVERIPRILIWVKKSPIIGWGFSNTFWMHKDGHVANHMMVLNSGLIGYTILMFLLFSWIHKIFTLSNRNKMIRLLYGNAPKIFALFFIFIFIVHSTSSAFWGLVIGLPRIFVISAIMASYNAIANTTNRKKEEI